VNSIGRIKSLKSTILREREDGFPLYKQVLNTYTKKDYCTLYFIVIIVCVCEEINKEFNITVQSEFGDKLSMNDWFLNLYEVTFRNFSKAIGLTWKKNDTNYLNEIKLQSKAAMTKPIEKWWHMFTYIKKWKYESPYVTFPFYKPIPNYPKVCIYISDIA